MSVAEVGLVTEAWYVAALSHELEEGLLARKILDHPIVFYRAQDGKPVAMLDRCPHRRYPLSEGRLEGNCISCRYHGFVFNEQGRCVRAAGVSKVPRASVRTFPTIERGPFVWIWMGTGDADADQIPRHPWLNASGWTTITGLAHLKARYALLVDNLLDLSHETHIHSGSIGTPDVASTGIETRVEPEAGVVYVNRRMLNVECPPFYAEYAGVRGRIDRWQDIEYRLPSLYVLHSRIAPAGILPGDDGSDPEAAHLKVIFGITPETETSTHDFWALARDFDVGNAEVSEKMSRSNTKILEEDIEVLERLELVVAEEGSTPEVSVANDAGALAARKLLKKRMRTE